MVLSELVRSSLLFLSKACSWFPCKSANEDPADSGYYIDDIAWRVAHHGSRYEKKKKKSCRVLRSTNANHALYLEKLAERLARDQDADIVTIPAPFTVPRFHDTIKLRVRRYSSLPSPVLEGVTAKEYDTIKLIAQFVVRYDQYSFLRELQRRNDPQFDFLFGDPRTDERCTVFNWLWSIYASVIMPWHKMRTPSREDVVDAFIKLVRGEGGFVSGLDYFANIQMPPPGQSTKNKNSQLIQSIDSAASAVACLGSWLEEKIKEDNGSSPQFSFLLRTDVNHALYRKKLGEYRAHKGLVKVPAPYRQPDWDHNPPDLPPCPFPHGITRKEYETITLTAQFAVQYRTLFLHELKKRKEPRFDFVESRSGDKFIVFCWLCALYSRVILPCHKLSMPYPESIVEAFIQLLQGEKRVTSFDYFADIQMLQPLGYRSSDDQPINTSIMGYYCI